MSGPVVGVEFTGNSVGAVGAARSTATAIGTVRREANTLSPSLHRTEQDLGRVTRGGLAGTGMFRGLGRSVAFASAAFLGGYGLAAAIRGATDELVANIKYDAQARAAIRSTGGVAGVTTKMINGLAAAEQRKTGVDKEQVKAAEVMLLRYTNVRNVVGEGNNIFGRATTVALDLSTALGRDVSDAAFALGKALNDPVRGVMQLRRVGAAFTADEQTQIKTLAEHGKVLEAQKLILDSLTKSYGGTAKAVSDVAPWQRLRSSLKELSADALRPLLPDIDSLIGRAQRWVDAFAKNRAEQQRLKHDVEQVAHAVGDAAKTVNQAAGVMGGWGNVIKALLALKVASTLSSWAGGLKSFTGAALPAGQRTGALLTNMRSLARIGTLSIGVDLLFQSKGQGAKGLLGALLTGAAVGSAFGPWGMLLGGTAALTIDVFVQQGSSKGYKYSRAQEERRARNQTLNEQRVHAGMTLSQLEDIANSIPLRDQPAFEKLMETIRKEGRGARVSRQQASAYNRRHAPGGVGGHDVASTARALGVGSGLVYGENLQKAGLPPAPGRSQILDCSSYVYEVYTRAGYKGFPDVSTTQWKTERGPNWTSRIIPLADAKPGDVVFYNVPGGEGPPPNHVGIVVSGSGRSAMVMQYYASGYPAGNYAIIQRYPIAGVKRFFLIGKQSGTGGASSPDTSGSASATAAAKNAVSVVTGSNLIPIGLRGAIGHAANMATTTHGLVAARWLHTEIQDLEHARRLLEEKLKSASGKQRTAIQQEIQSIDTAIARTQKAFAGALAGWAKMELAKLEKSADAQFQKKTAAYISNVLAPRYFQGTDAQGNQRLTPAEKLLQQMQAQDELLALQSNLAHAQTPEEKAAAQRALDEYNLQIQATKERAQADADYAKAVAKYQKQRDKLEAKLNASLSRFVDQVARGTAALSDLAKVLAHYGLSGSDGGNGGGPGRRRRRRHAHVPGGVTPASGVLAMAGGGRVPGPTYVNSDSVPAFLTPGETVIDKGLTAALERVFLGGGGPMLGGVGDVYMDSYKVGKTVARPVADAQRRQISYTLQRG